MMYTLFGLLSFSVSGFRCWMWHFVVDTGARRCIVSCHFYLYLVVLVVSSSLNLSSRQIHVLSSCSPKPNSKYEFQDGTSKHLLPTTDPRKEKEKGLGPLCMYGIDITTPSRWPRSAWAAFGLRSFGQLPQSYDLHWIWEIDGFKVGKTHITALLI